MSSMWPSTTWWPQSEIAHRGVSDQGSCMRCWGKLLKLGQEAEGRGGAHRAGSRAEGCAAGLVQARWCDNLQAGFCTALFATMSHAVWEDVVSCSMGIAQGPAQFLTSELQAEQWAVLMMMGSAAEHNQSMPMLSRAGALAEVGSCSLWQDVEPCVLPFTCQPVLAFHWGHIISRPALCLECLQGRALARCAQHLVL